MRLENAWLTFMFSPNFVTQIRVFTSLVLWKFVSSSSKCCCSDRSSLRDDALLCIQQQHQQSLFEIFSINANIHRSSFWLAMTLSMINADWCLLMLIDWRCWWQLMLPMSMLILMLVVKPEIYTIYNLRHDIYLLYSKYSQLFLQI